MKRVEWKRWAALCGAAVLVAGTNVGFGADEDAFAQGEFKRLAEPLAVIFDFKIEDGKLAFNREAWKAAAEEIKQKQTESLKLDPNKLPPGIAPNTPQALRYQARQLEQQASEMERMQRFGELPPLQYLMRNFQEALTTPSRRAGLGSFGPQSSSRSNGWFEYRSSFGNQNIVGSLQSNSDGETLEISERETPRKLEFVASNGGGFHIQATLAEGGLLLIRQLADGHFVAIAIHDGTVSLGAAATFRDFSKQNRELTDRWLLPALAEVGVRPFVSFADKKVRFQAIAQLKKAAGNASAEKLIADLNDDTFATREAASQMLSALYTEYKEAIERRLKDPTISAEERTTLPRIVDSQREVKPARRTIEVFELLKDPEFLLALLDRTNASEKEFVVRQLETVTGEKFGTDSDKWMSWIQSNRPVVAVRAEQMPPALQESDLISDGAIQRAQNGLSKLLRFKIDNGRLSLNRAGWGSVEPADEKDPLEEALKNAGDENERKSIEAARKIALFRPDPGPKPAILNVFEMIHQAAGRNGASGSGSGGTGDETTWHADFVGDTLAGNVQSSKKSEQVTLRETTDKRRVLDFRRLGESGFMIQLTAPSGDMLTMRQGNDGVFCVIAISGDKTFADQQPSYGEFVKAHREWMEQQFLPALAKFGFSTREQSEKDAAK